MIIDSKCQWRNLSWKGEGVNTCKNLTNKKKFLKESSPLCGTLMDSQKSEHWYSSRRWSLSKEVKDRHGLFSGSLFSIYVADKQSGTWTLTLLCLYMQNIIAKWHFFPTSHELIWSMTMYYYLSWMDTFRNFSDFLKNPQWIAIWEC